MNQEERQVKERKKSYKRAKKEKEEWEEKQRERSPGGILQGTGWLGRRAGDGNYRSPFPENREPTRWFKFLEYQTGGCVLPNPFSRVSTFAGQMDSEWGISRLRGRERGTGSGATEDDFSEQAVTRRW